MDIVSTITQSNLPNDVKAACLEALEYKKRQTQHKRLSVMAKIFMAVMLDLHKKHGPGAVIPYSQASMDEVDAKLTEGCTPHFDTSPGAKPPTVGFKWMNG